MPATQHDAVVWLSGSAYDVIFHMARAVIHDLAGYASLGEETSSWPYRHDRDLTGFIDGSENPTLLDAPTAALLPEGVSGAAGSVLLLQKWKHNVSAWEALQVEQQERIMGHTKLDSIELENKPVDSHVARTDQDEFGHIFRRNMPYGNIEDHGTVFVGFSADQKRPSRMLDSMAGLVTGTRDALTRFTQPLTGSYYFVPSVESLRRLGKTTSSTSITGSPGGPFAQELVPSKYATKTPHVQTPADPYSRARLTMLRLHGHLPRTPSLAAGEEGSHKSSQSSSNPVHPRC